MNTTPRRPAPGPDYATLATSLSSQAQHPRDLDQPATVDEAIEERMSAARDNRDPPEGEGDAANELPDNYEDTAQDVNETKRPPAASVPSTIGERTATTLEAYSASTIVNIRELSIKLTALEMFFVEDASQVKERIAAHMQNGQRVVAILAGIGDELKELEKRRDEMLRGHARGTR